MPKHQLKDLQQTFTDHIRSAEFTALNHVEDRRLNVYRELFINNIDSFISGTFPVLKECVDVDTWNQMVRTFFIEHRAESPYFLEISEEFLGFLSNASLSDLGIPDYAYSLAHWEWLELFADAYVEQAPIDLPKSVNLERDILSTIECAWLQAYEYPVHLIEPNSQVIAQPAFLLIYRNRDLEVGFIELNPLSYLLFQALEKNANDTIETIVNHIAKHNGMNSQQLLAGAMVTISQWIDLQLITKVNS